MLVFTFFKLLNLGGELYIADMDDDLHMQGVQEHLRRDSSPIYIAECASGHVRFQKWSFNYIAQENNWSSSSAKRERHHRLP